MCPSKGTAQAFVFRLFPLDAIESENAAASGNVTGCKFERIWFFVWAPSLSEIVTSPLSSSAVCEHSMSKLFLALLLRLSFVGEALGSPGGGVRD